VAPRSVTIIRSGFTLVELMIGMAITTLTLGALAAITLAMSTSWRASSEETETAMIANITRASMDKHIRTARAVGAVETGSFDNTGPAAAMVVWVRDANEDNLIQLLELEMIAFNPTEKRVERFQPLDVRDDEDLTPEQFKDPAMIARIYGDFTMSPLLPRIDAMRFHNTGTADHAEMVEASIRVKSGRQRQAFSVVTTLRGSAKDSTP